MNNEQITVTRITEFNIQLINELTMIEAGAFGDGGLNRWTFPVFIRHGAVYVLKCGDKMCGVTDIIRSWRDIRLAFIVGFAIREGERGKGFGCRLLDGLIKGLKNDGVKKIQLTVDPDNKSAIKLYGKFGFKAIADLPNEYGPAIDRQLLELELEE